MGSNQFHSKKDIILSDKEKIYCEINKFLLDELSLLVLSYLKMEINGELYGTINC